MNMVFKFHNDPTVSEFKIHFSETGLSVCERKRELGEEVGKNKIERKRKRKDVLLL